MRFFALALTVAAIVAAAIWIDIPRDRVTLESISDRPLESLASTSFAMPMLAEVAELIELEQAHHPAVQFWQRDMSAQVQRIERILSAEQDARAALLARFGPQITQSSLFWRLFRPLHERMPQLSAQQQMAIHELERLFMARTLELDGHTSFDEHVARIRQELGVDLATEYALRSSPLADELRRSSPDLSEMDFRDAFAALSKIGSATDSAQFIAARKTLRERLGNRRFARLWSMRDPRFAQVESTARRFDLTEETTLTAYAMLLENQEAMLTAAAHANSAGRQDEMRQLYAEGRRRLQEFVGAAAADALVQAAAGTTRRNIE